MMFKYDSSDKMLVSAFKKAMEDLSEAKLCFKLLSEAVDPKDKQEWTLLEAEAKKKRGAALHIYDMLGKKGESNLSPKYCG